MIKLEVERGEGSIEIEGSLAEVTADTIIILRGIRDAVKAGKGDSVALAFEQCIENIGTQTAFHKFQDKGGVE